MTKNLLSISVCIGLLTMPAIAETIYVPSYQERPHGLIEYGVNWLFGAEQSRGPAIKLPPQPSYAECQDAIESDSGQVLNELKNWYCTPYHK